MSLSEQVGSWVAAAAYGLFDESNAENGDAARSDLIWVKECAVASKSIKIAAGASLQPRHNMLS